MGAVQGYDAGGSLLPGRNYSSSSYAFGFNGMRKDDEIHGATGTSYDFGARLYDSRIMRWLSLDPEAKSLPSESHYSFAANNPIGFIDEGGRIWVNYYTALVAKQKELALNNPDDRKVQKQLERLMRLETETNAMIDDLKKYDPALHAYIENLTISKFGAEMKVPVIVRKSDDRSASAEGTEASRGSGAIGTTVWIDYSGGVYEPNATYNGTEIMEPATRLPGKKALTPGFLVTIYAGSVNKDISLANEAGDVMHFMEYNRDAFKEGGNAGMSWDKYANGGSGKYSFDVEDMYKSRKKERLANPDAEQSNPYPLKKQ